MQHLRNLLNKTHKDTHSDNPVSKTDKTAPRDNHDGDTTHVLHLYKARDVGSKQSKSQSRDEILSNHQEFFKFKPNK